MNIEIITSVIIGMAIYNMILKSIGIAFLKVILNTKTGQEKSKEVRKTFEERLKEKQEEK